MMLKTIASLFRQNLRKPVFSVHPSCGIPDHSIIRSRGPALHCTHYKQQHDHEESVFPPSTPMNTHMPFSKFDELLPQHIETEAPRIPFKSDSFAHFIDSSKTLQALALLGVELYKIEEKHPDTLNFIVSLDLEDLKSKIEFLVNFGVRYSEVGSIITKWPKLLDPKRDTQQFEEIISYLIDKDFEKKEILALINRVPMVLTMPLEVLDGMLGHYQRLPTNRGEKPLRFSNAEVKSIILRCPTLLRANLRIVYEQVRTLELSCGFTLGQIRRLVYVNPWILLKDDKQLELLYKFYTRELQLSAKEITDFPGCFGTRIQKVLERHKFLKHHGKAQYFRDKPGYISLPDLYELSDEDLCIKYSLGTVHDFKKFIKTAC